MILKIQVRGQVMKPLIKNVLANHSQEFSRFVFFLSDDWDGLTTFAQFRQGDAAYNVYLDSENACYLPPEIAAGKVSLMLYGTGEEVIGTTNAITMCVSDNKYVSDAQSTEITESLYQQLVNEVRAVIPSGGTVGQVLTRAANGKTAWSDAGTPTQEQITTATDAWLEENVAQETGYVLDSSLTMSNAAAPADKVGDLKSAIENLEAIPHSVKMAMDTLFSKAAYADDDAASSYATFHAWATANPVTSITAVFTQGSAVIYDTDSLDTLKQYLVVTANFSDSTTATVTDYTLSGTLTEGTSTITVSYGGKTDTFTVAVTKYWDIEWDYTQGTPIGKGFAHTSAVVGSMTEEGYRLEGASSGGCNLITDPTTTADIGVSEITIKFNQIYPSMIGFHFDVKGIWAAIINNNKLGYKITANNPGKWGADDVVQVQNITISTGVEYTFRLEWNTTSGASLWLNGEQMYSINSALTQANRTRWFVSVPSDCVVIVKSMRVKVVS